MKKFKNSFDAFWWAFNHPKFRGVPFYEPTIDLVPHMVNPDNETIERDKTLNTSLRWWVEGIGHTSLDDGSIVGYNDYDLHTGGKTADEAVINFANLVYKKHGDYE